MSDNSHYTLGLAFDSDDPEFTRGVEVGLMYKGLQLALLTGASRLSRAIHASNAEMALRIAERFNVSFRGEEIDENWLRVTFVVKGEGE